MFKSSLKKKNYYTIFKYKIHKYTTNTKIKIQIVVKTINLLLLKELKEYKNILSYIKYILVIYYKNTTTIGFIAKSV